MDIEAIIAKAEAADKATYTAEPTVEDPITLTATQIIRHRQSLRRAVEAEFRKDLEQEVFGLYGLPAAEHVAQTKLDKLWDYAWSEGHSAGYYSVADIYEELSELVK